MQFYWRPRRFSECFLLVLVSGCQTPAVIQSPEVGEHAYRTLNYPSAMTIDVDNATKYSWVGDDGVGVSVSICTDVDTFICFFQHGDPGFAFPRCLKEGETSWEFRGLRYELKHPLSSPLKGQESLHLVQAFEDERLRGVFLFSYQTGLVFIAHVKQVVVDGYENNVIVVAQFVDGVGFGASTSRSCPGNVNK